MDWEILLTLGFQNKNICIVYYIIKKGGESVLNHEVNFPKA